MPAESRAPVTSYIAAAVPPGSIDHVALLMTADALRPAAAAAIALGRLIATIPVQGKESEIRQIKLAWWLEEIERTGGGEPRHPLTADLAGRIAHRDWLTPLRLLVEAAMQHTTQPPVATLQQLLPYCHQAAERQSLIASVLPECDELALHNARKIGVGVCLTETIRDAGGRDARVAPDGFADGTSAVQLARLAQDHFDDIEPAPATQRQAQRSIYLQRHLYRHQLDRLRAKDYDAARSKLHPVFLLWHAWRGARKLAR